jgi:transposase
MKQSQVTLDREVSIGEKVLYMALELSGSRWKLGFSDGGPVRETTIEARNLLELHEQIGKAKGRLGMASSVRVLSCYEAGRDGFWLHRHLMACNTENLVVDSSSIEVNRRARRAKTDRLDVRKLVGMLIRHHRGEKGLWSVVRVPTVEEEDARQVHRELENLRGERTAHRNRIRSLVVLHGIGMRNVDFRKFEQFMGRVGQWDGQPLPRDLQERLKREYERLVLVEGQIKGLEQERVDRIKDGEGLSVKQVVLLSGLFGIGQRSAWLFVMEFFGWRKFNNRRELASAAGLSPTPYNSGGSLREQGIGKSGNGRVRDMAIEIAWYWLRHQPQSKLSIWFGRRFAQGGKRMRRIGIVAVARRLLIDLWRMVQYGVIPDGARLKAA